MNLNRLVGYVICSCLLSFSTLASEQKDFELRAYSTDRYQSVKIKFKPGIHLYADSLAVKDSYGKELDYKFIGEKKVGFDEFSESDKAYFDEEVVLIFNSPTLSSFTVNYQGCIPKKVCFFPQSVEFGYRYGRWEKVQD